MSNRKTILFVCLMIGILALGAVSSGLAQAPDKIKLGLMFGLTGPASPIGPVQMKGAELAINEINAAGGVKLGGKKVLVEAVTRDDETKGDVAVRRFKELRDEVKVAGLVGSTFAPIAKALNNQIVNEPLMYVSSCVAPMEMFAKKETGSNYVWYSWQRLCHRIFRGCVYCYQT